MFILNHEKATIILPLPTPFIPEEVLSVAKKEGFKLKSEFHVTIVSFQNGKKLIQNGVDFQKVVALAEQYSWETIFLPEYFILERTIKAFILNGKVETPEHTRRTIIQKLDIPDLARFFARLSELSGVVFEVPIAHITIFSWSDYEPEVMKGLSLNSQVDFDKYCKNQIQVTH